MAQEMKFKLVVVMAHELRTAAKAIRSFQQLAEKGDMSAEAVEARTEALKDALDACYTALHGVDDKSALMLLDADHVIKWNAARDGEASHEPG